MTDKENTMAKPPSNLLTAQVTIGLNALGFLLDKQATQGDLKRYPAYEIAQYMSAGLSHVQHAIIPLSEAGILDSAKGPNGGHRLNPEALQKFTVVETIRILGQNVPEPNGGDRPSDLITDAIYDILNVSLEEFFRQ